MKRRMSCIIISMVIIFSLFASCDMENDKVNTENTYNIITENPDYYNKYMKKLNLAPISYRADSVGGKFSNYIIADENIPENRIEFTIVPTSIAPIVDLKKSGIAVDKIFKDYYGIYAEEENNSLDADVERSSVKYDDCIDEKNGRIKDGFIMVLVEYEVNNINCDFQFFEDSNIDNSECYYSMWHLYNMVDLSDGVYMSMPIYFDEYGRDLSDIPDAIKIEKGETAKIHVGYILKSGGDTPYSKVGMDFYGHFYGGMEASELEYSFDLSKEAAVVLAAS